MSSKTRLIKVRSTAKYLMFILILCLMNACFKSRTYLTDEEKSWNPYKSGQVLIFESSNYERDTIFIENLDFGFPDGLGVVDYNESLYVSAEPTGPDLGKYFSNTYALLKIVAKTAKEVSYLEFGIKVQGAQFIDRQRYSFEDLDALAETWLTVPYGKYIDVIAVGNKSDYSDISTAIETIYWSKSKGYLRLDKYDGTSWELVDIIELE